MSLLVLVLGLVLFIGIHSVAIVAPAWREVQRQRLGEGAWKGVYSLISLVGLLLIVHGYGAARLHPVPLYTPPVALRHLSLLLMVPVFPLLLATYLPGRLQRAARHPTLVATKLWATAHLLANGNLADLLLFGTFLAWAVADRIAAGRRAVQRQVPGAPPSPFNDAIAVVIGLALYTAFLFGVHAWLIGVSPLG